MKRGAVKPVPPVRILVVDDHPVVCDGVRNLLAAHSDLRVVGEANEPGTAVRLAGELQPERSCYR